MTQDDAPTFPSLLQPAPGQGYRYNIDSFLLARFARFRAGERVCDLGAGVGVLSFLALLRGGVKEVSAVEIQENLADLALRNSETLDLKDKMTVFRASWKDVTKYLRKSSYDMVVSNPPYRKGKTGRLPPDSGKAAAKHEIDGTLADLVKAARYLLKPSGRLCLMYPPLRLEELIVELHRIKMKLHRLAWVHPFADKPATLFMAEAVRSVPRELKVEAPVIVYQDPDRYMPDVEEWVGKKMSASVHERPGAVSPARPSRPLSDRPY